MSSKGVDTMLTQTPAKLLSVLIPNVSCQRIVRLTESSIPIELNTTAIAALKAVECEISSRGCSESIASWNCRPESVGCPEPRCVRNASGTLRPRSYEGLRFDCYHWMVVENGIRIVVTPGLITCCDEPVETID
jgi:hypothetical protein